MNARIDKPLGPVRRTITKLGSKFFNNNCDGDHDIEKETRERLQQRLVYNWVYKENNKPAIMEQY